MALIDKLNAIGDAIRSKTGGTDRLSLPGMVTAIESIQTGSTGTPAIIGTFTPSSSDYVSGGSIKVAVPKFPRGVLVVAPTIDTTTIDRYSPGLITVLNFNETIANGNTVYICARYKSSTTNAASYATGCTNSANAWSTSRTATDSSSYTYSICVTSSMVYFKTYGNYRFRADTLYQYYIMFD